MSSCISIITKDGWKSFKVPKEISLYIQQLERYIKYPTQSKLKEVYKERFVNTQKVNVLTETKN